VVSILLLVNIVLTLLTWVIIASAILSWLVAFNVVNTRNPVVQTIGDVLARITEPLLAPIRRFVPNLGGLDVSPVVAILLLWLLQDLNARYLIPSVARAGL
jgi:YggT family protein